MVNRSKRKMLAASSAALAILLELVLVSARLYLRQPPPQSAALPFEAFTSCLTS